jgi:hypothetical protein
MKPGWRRFRFFFPHLHVNLVSDSASKDCSIPPFPILRSPLRSGSYLPLFDSIFCVDFFHENPLRFDEELNWNTEGGNGTNRFATLLFYLSDVPLGGETIFPDASVWWHEPTQSVVSSGRPPTLEPPFDFSRYCRESPPPSTPTADSTSIPSVAGLENI